MQWCISVIFTQGLANCVNEYYLLVSMCKKINLISYDEIFRGGDLFFYFLWCVYKHKVDIFIVCNYYLN